MDKGGPLNPRDAAVRGGLFIAPIALVFCLAGCSNGGSPAGGGTGGRPDGWPPVFRIGSFSGNDTDETLEERERFRQHLENQLGVPVEVRTGTNYTAMIEAMRADRIEAINIGPFSYILAVEEARAEALAVGIYSLDEPRVYDETLPPHYYSVLITRKGSGVNALEDLRGTDFAFVDPASTSGHLFPKAFLLKSGIDPDTEMNTVYAGSHPSAVLSVYNGKATAGATLEHNLHRMGNAGMIGFCGFPDGRIGRPRAEEEIRRLFEECPEGKLAILAFSDPIPRTPFAVREELPPGFKARVKEVLLDIKNFPELIEQTGRWFIDPTGEFGLESVDAFYDPVRETAKLLDLDLKRLDSR